MLLVGDKRFETGDIIGCTRAIRGAQRETLEVNIKGSTYAELADTFVDGMDFTIRQEEQTIRYEERPAVDEEGNPILTEDGHSVLQQVAVTDTIQADYPKTEYCVAGDIVDKRNGGFVVYMSMRTEAEKECEQKEQLMLELLIERGAIA